MKKLPVYEMMISDDMDSDLMVDFIALVDRPAIKKDFVKFNDQFVEPTKGERKDDFIPRCISYVVSEGKEAGQAAAICYSMWDQHFSDGVTHYTKDGKPYTGPTHLDSFGKLMSGAVHSAHSVYLYHMNDLFIQCANCEHSWNLTDGGEMPYKCHNCEYVNKPQLFAESWNDYPDAAVENAKTALRWVEKNGWGECGEASGKIRANQIANREKLTRETIARMSAFKRHKQNSDRPLGEGCGRLMWLCWGGDEGIAWAERKLKQIDRGSFAIQDEEKRIISGPLMIANQRIFRTDPELGDYEVFFSPETIKKIAIKLAKMGFHNNVNLMHNADMKVPGVTLFEIFQSDKARGIRPMKGFEDLADGSLFGSMYVENDVAWQMVKDGMIKGFSVEGNFGMKKKDEYAEQFEKIVEILNSTTF